MTVPRSKRFRFAVYAFHVFAAMGVYAMRIGADLSALAVYMTATAIPLVAYIIGDTIRGSVEKDQLIK